jgi:hypothetical protein
LDSLRTAGIQKVGLEVKPSAAAGGGAPTTGGGPPPSKPPGP